MLGYAAADVMNKITPATLALKTPLAMLLLLPLCFRRNAAQPMLFSLAILPRVHPAPACDCSWRHWHGRRFELAVRKAVPMVRGGDHPSRARPSGRTA